MIQNGQLAIQLTQLDGYKPIVYVEVPPFDQSTQYASQGEITEYDDRIEVDVEIKELSLQDEYIAEDVEPGFIEYPPRNERHKEDLATERLTLLEDVLLTLMME